MTIEEEQHEPMLRHDDLAEQIEHMEPLAVGGMYFTRKGWFFGHDTKQLNFRPTS